MSTPRSDVSPAKPRRALGWLATASFLNDFGSDLIAPIWPMFVTQVLGANLAVLGLVEGIGEAVVSLSKALSGWVSDRVHKRKPFIWSGYLFGSFARAGYAVVTSWTWLLPLRILDRSGKIRSAPRDAMVAEDTDRASRGKAFGILRMMDNLGAVAGITLCLLLFPLLGYRTLMWLAAIPSLFAVALLLFGLRESAGKPAAGVRAPWVWGDWTPAFRWMVVSSLLYTLGSFSYAFLIIYAGKCGYRDTSLPWLYLLFTLAAAASSLPFGRWADQVGRKTVLWVGYGLWVVCLTLLLFVKTLWVWPMVFVLYGLHKGALEPVQKTLVSELSPAAWKASGLGMYQMALGFGALGASGIAGWLWEKWGAGVPITVSLVLTLVSVVTLVGVKESRD